MTIPFAGDCSARANATAILHEPIIMASAGTNAPGQQPDLVTIGSLLVAEFTLDTDAAYRLFKVPREYVGGEQLEVHWTKSIDADESGKAVRWKVSYTTFDGITEDVNVAPTVVEIEDTYDDAGTTTRIVHRTAQTPISGLVADEYIAVKIEATTPVGTPLVGEPALVTLDLFFDVEINR